MGSQAGLVRPAISMEMELGWRVWKHSGASHMVLPCNNSNSKEIS